MRRWSELAERVAATTRTSEKTGLLAEYLRTLDADELPIAVVFLTGRPFPEADQRATGIGWATIANALGQVSGSSRADLGAAYDRHSDLSAAVGDVLEGAGHAPDPAISPSLVDVAATFTAIEAASGPAKKAQLLAALLARADPKTARGIVRVLSGELRIGLREGLVEAAIAKAFDRALDESVGPDDGRQQPRELHGRCRRDRLGARPHGLALRRAEPRPPIEACDHPATTTDGGPERLPRRPEHVVARSQDSVAFGRHLPMAEVGVGCFEHRQNVGQRSKSFGQMHRASACHALIPVLDVDRVHLHRVHGAAWFDHS